MPARCPVCSTVLTRRDAPDLSFEVCERCGGMWVDNATSRRLTEEDLSPEAFQLLRTVGSSLADRSTDGERSPAPRPCPICGEPLSAAQVAQAGVEVDVCAAHGTFFDAQELARVYQAFATKRAVDDADAEDFARDLAEARRDSVLRHTWWGRLFASRK